MLLNRRTMYLTKGQKYTIAGLALVLMLTIVCSLGYLVVKAVTRPTDGSTSSSGIVYDMNAVEGGWEAMSEEEITAALNSKVEEGLINISMNASPVFADGKAEGNLMIVNELTNTYPQRVEIFRNDTEELIYTSGAVAVGSKIEAAALDVVLEAGSYPCTALFHALDPETGAVIGTAGAIINITIKS